MMIMKISPPPPPPFFLFKDLFHEIFNGLVNDSCSTIEFILDEIRTNVRNEKFSS